MILKCDNCSRISIILVVFLVLLALAGGFFILDNNRQENLPPKETACENQCGDGVCQEIVCLAIGCPCSETEESCSQDCARQ